MNVLESLREKCENLNSVPRLRTIYIYVSLRPSYSLSDIVWSCVNREELGKTVVTYFGKNISIIDRAICKYVAAFCVPQAILIEFFIYKYILQQWANLLLFTETSVV